MCVSAGDIGQHHSEAVCSISAVLPPPFLSQLSVENRRRGHALSLSLLLARSLSLAMQPTEEPIILGSVPDPVLAMPTGRWTPISLPAQPRSHHPAPLHSFHLLCPLFSSIPLFRSVLDRTLGLKIHSCFWNLQ